MTQLEIYSILGQNFTIVQEDNNDAQRMLLTSTTDIVTQVIANSDVMSQFGFMRQFERQVRDITGLDMFSVRTRFVQNLFVTGASNQFLNQNAVDRNRVGNYFDNTSVSIGKYIGKDMFVQGMVKIKYDERSTILGGITFEPDFGIELQSPFFKIRWDFFPYHPENWYINDSSISIIWSKSF